MSDHFDYLQRLTEEGVALLIGRTLTKDYSQGEVSSWGTERVFRIEPVFDKEVTTAYTSFSWAERPTLFAIHP